MSQDTKMNQYILDSASTMQGLIANILLEGKCIDQLNTQRLLSEDKYAQQARIDLRFHTNEIDIPEDEKYLAWYRVRKEVSDLRDEINFLESSILFKKQFITILCGAMLQVAKYGIFSTHHRLSDCPNGRSIGSEVVKNIVWQGQKQCIESTSGKFSQPVKECFSNLETSFGSQFSLQTRPVGNLATHIIEILGWKDYSMYESDMTTLLYY